MSIKLSVPLVTQRASMECWYVSVMMVAYFRREGPRRGLPDKWIVNRGITLPDFIRLAKVEGLESLVTPVGDLASQQIEIFLRNHGPIWCAGHWDGVGHIIVLTGIDQQTVYINDPSPTKGRREETLSWFNQKLDRIPHCMMYMPR